MGNIATGHRPEGLGYFDGGGDVVAFTKRLKDIARAKGATSAGIMLKVSIHPAWRGL